MNKDIALSIIIPVFNNANTIAAALASVFNVKDLHGNVEVIVVNDESQDNSDDIIKRLRTQYDFRYFTIAHAGAGGARNKGIKEACGEYLLFLDADDTLITDALCTFLDYLHAAHSDVITYSIKCINVNGDCIKITKAPAIQKGKGDMVLDNWIKTGYYSALRDKVVARSYLTDNNLMFIPDIMYEDIAWTIKLFAYDPSLEYCGLCLYENRLNKYSSTSRPKNMKCLDSLITTFADLKSFLENEGLSSSYKNSLQVIMSDIFWQALSYAGNKQIPLTQADRISVIEYLERNKHIMIFSKKFNRRVVYRLIGEWMGVKFLAKLKR